MTFLATVVVTLVGLYLNRPRKPSEVKLVHVGEDVSITYQLNPQDIHSLWRNKVRTVVDIRPDGEEKGQPSSEEMQRAAKRANVDFFYIPVPHDSIPDEAVAQLSDVLSTRASPLTVLYCRTGRRAVRLYALAEASRNDGPAVDEILKMVRDAGFVAEDLKDEIARRISLRNVSNIKAP